MKIINYKVFEGKNIYSHKKCIRMEVDLCGYCDIPSKDIPDFNLDLVYMLPELKTHRCGIDEDFGFIKRLEEGTYLTHICEHIIIAIQNKLGIEVAYGKSREIKGDLYYMVFQYEYPKVALETAKLAIDIINSLINREKIDFELRYELLKQILSNEVIGPSTRAIQVAAERYGLPMTKLGDGDFYQIGYGKQGRVIEGTIGYNTRCIAADISCDKLLTKQLLDAQNIPVARGVKVSNVINLIRDGEKLGYPLVLKPRYGNKGKGIFLNIKNKRELIDAYNQIRDKYQDIILEKNVEGNDYRVCVVDNDVIAVSLRKPPFIIGDGISTIRDLILQMNKDPNRGYDHEKPLTKIKVNDELMYTLEKQGYNLDAVLIAGEKVYLRENANLSTGGFAIDCTDKICEENKRLCIRAAKAIGLDICGIDIKSRDISVPLYEQGVVVEVNASPGIRMHLHPTLGKFRDVGEAILNMQYNGVPHNIPLISITGTNGKTTTTRLISYVLRNMGYNVGMTTTEGIYIGSECIEKGDTTGFYSAKAVLLNKDVDVAVLETARGGIIRKGLAYDVADVAVITNVTEDHLGIDSINSMEELAFVKALVGEAVKEEGYVVINADDKWSKKIINRITAKKIYFSKNKYNPLFNEDIEDSIAVYVDNGILYVRNDHKEYKIINIVNIPITLNGVLEFNVENVMAACAALVAIGVDYCMIAKGLKSFKLDRECNNGRFNVYNINGIKIILDYGHNIDGYTRIFESIKKMDKNKVIGVVGVPGDRTDDNMRKIGEICSDNLDVIIIKEDKDKRGREVGEVTKLIKEGINNKNSDKNVIDILDEREALNKALSIANNGDIVIVFYEDMDKLIEVIKNLENNIDSSKIIEGYSI